MLTDWLSENVVEVFGAVTGIAYVILEIKRNILLWPLGIITSAVYIYVFGSNGFYANMGLQVYYLVISFYGWYIWQRAHKERSDAVAQSAERRAKGEELMAQGTQGAKRRSPAKREGAELRAKDPGSGTDVMRIGLKTAIICLVITLVLWGLLWYVLDRWTDSSVPVWDGLIASMSVVATWMLTKKYLEQWYVWIVANAIATVVYLASGLYPTAVLFFVYFVMAIVGVVKWSKDRMTARPSDFRPSDIRPSDLRQKNENRNPRQRHLSHP